MYSVSIYDPGFEFLDTHLFHSDVAARAVANRVYNDYKEKLKNGIDVVDVDKGEVVYSIGVD